MKSVSVVTLILSVFFSLSLSAQENAPSTEVQEYIELITSSEPLSSAQLGVKAVSLTGRTIADYRSSQMLVPASNVKLLTTGIAMQELGSDFKFETSISYTGSIVDGTLEGDLYIIGGGDPTIGSKDSIATPVQSLFSKWKKFMTDAGIKKVNGNIIGDGSYFDGPQELASWLYEDIGTYYGTGMNALAFYRNVQDFRVTAGATVGADLKISPSYPKSPWMTFTYDCSTGVKGSGDKLYLYATDLAPLAQMRGTFAVDRSPKTVECSNKFGAYTCAWEFCEYLKSNGIEVTGKAADVDSQGMVRTELGESSSVPAKSGSERKQLGISYSSQISRISYITNQRSDNFYAEALLRVLAKKKLGSADYESCTMVASDAIRRLGLDPSTGMYLVDGSGLSRKNLVSPEFFCDFLTAMLDSPVCEPFVESLPQPGKSSQVGRMRAEDPAAAARVLYKSGSMEGVRCYSGYVIPTDGSKEDIIVFSVMVNNYTGPTWKIMGEIDRIIALIAKEN